MVHSIQRRRASWPKVPPWIVLATVLGAVLLAGVMFSRDYRRERGHFEEIFLQRGEVLIHSLEMLGRLRFGENGDESRLLVLWNNLEDEANVLFMALTDEKGRPVAQVGGIRPDPSVFEAPQPRTSRGGHLLPSFRRVKIDGRWIYMVYRPFRPLPPRRMMGQGWGRQPGTGGDRPGRLAPSPPPPEGWTRPKGDTPVRYLWVGFDLTPFEQLSQSRVRTAAVFIGLFCLAGLAGVLALFWGHNSRMARQLYQDTNALAAELIGRLPVGVILKDASGRVTLVNRATSAMSGLPETAFLGRTMGEMTYGRFPAEETLAAREVNLSFQGGETVRAALTAGPVVSDDGHPLGQVVLMEDLGELGRLKEELAKKERLATLGGLAAGLAHEIRNPLGALRGLTQHLLNKGPADPRDRDALEVMLASVDRLNATITDFLDYARPTEIKTGPLDLADLVRSLATLAGHDARAQAVELDLRLPDRPVVIAGDEALLAQAFLNLYLNAIEAAGSGREGGRLTVALAAGRSRAVLTFHDNGPGFGPEQLAHPFVPYFTTKAEGNGLGLALVEKTVRAHHGADISLATPPEGGGLVTISFPLPESEPAHEPSPPTPDSHR